MKRIIALFLCFMLGAALIPMAQVNATAAEDAEMLDEIIIGFYDISQFPGKEKQYNDELAKILRDGLSQVSENVYVVKADDLSKNPTAILNKYKNSDFIEYVEPNYVAKAELAANDPEYKTYIRKGSSGLHLEEMWDIVTHVSSLVAVLDTGVYSGHSEFGGRVHTGYDFVNNVPNATTDDNGHGTRVAGVIAAEGNNGVMVAGVNWGAQILPVKVLDSSGKGSVSNIAKGIRWAADNGAKIINMSLGTTADTITMRDAVNYAAGKGCILVAAAGNTGLGSVEYPARYDNVIGVGSDTGAGVRAAYSCYGQGLDIIAPGSCRTTTSGGKTGSSSGTSFASPQVAGVLSLVLEFCPGLDMDGTRELISKGASTKGDAGWTAETGYGYMDYEHFVLTAQGQGYEQPPADSTPPTLTLFGGYDIDLVEGDSYEEPGWSAEDETDGNLDAAVVVTGKVSTAYAGDYTLTYTVTDKAGNTASTTRTIRVAAAPEPSIDVPVEPTLTAVGSNPIILHLGGSPYTEQGAIAFDELDGDISDQVVISGDVDTSEPGTYEVSYSVVNSAGLEATVTREVRVLAPQERYGARTPYSFDIQGKKGKSFQNSFTAEESGTITLSVSGLSKTTVTISVTDSDGNQVFGETCSSNGSWDFWAAEGDYSVDLYIDDAKGNAKVGLKLLMPEVLEVFFEEAEVPLPALPSDLPITEEPAESNTNTALLIGIPVIIIGLGLALLIRRRSTNK